MLKTSVPSSSTISDSARVTGRRSGCQTVLQTAQSIFQLVARRMAYICADTGSRTNDRCLKTHVRSPRQITSLFIHPEFSAFVEEQR